MQQPQRCVVTASIRICRDSFQKQVRWMCHTMALGKAWFKGCAATDTTSRGLHNASATCTVLQNWCLHASVTDGENQLVWHMV